MGGGVTFRSQREVEATGRGCPRWVVNSALSATATADPLLRYRAAGSPGGGLER